MIPATNSLPKPLADRGWDWSVGQARRTSAALKAQFYREDHRGLVKQHIRNRMQDSEVQDEVAAFASRANNLVRSVAEVVPVAYNRGATRELPGLGETGRRAFAALVAESGIARLAGTINALCWLLGPVLVGPCIVDGGRRLSLDVILPSQDEVMLAHPERVDSALWQSSGVWVELDGDAWRYYDGKGGEAAPTVYHDAGVCPVAIFRTEDYLLGWWGDTLHAGLVDASLDVAYKHALGLWSRQNSANFLTVINAELEGIPAGQTIGHPARPLVMHAPGQSPVSVFNRSINPAEYLSEMAAIIEAAVSRYGIPTSEISYAANNSNWGSLSIAVRGERLGLLRDKQVPWLFFGETQLWPLVCDVVRGSTHRLARVCPSGDEVRDALRVNFPDLASPADVTARIDAIKAGLPLGITNAADFFLQGRPELTREDADEMRRANLDTYAADIADLAARNLSPADVARGVESVAQLQGREGGRASGQTRLALAQENK